jgi:hypothetical protein
MRPRRCLPEQRYIDSYPNYHVCDRMSPRLCCTPGRGVYDVPQSYYSLCASLTGFAEACQHARKMPENDEDGALHARSRSAHLLYVYMQRAAHRLRASGR